jgi:hypothetical protein
MQAFVQLAAQNKQARRGQTVGNHLNHRPWYASWLPV